MNIENPEKLSEEEFIKEFIKINTNKKNKDYSEQLEYALNIYYKEEPTK